MNEFETFITWSTFGPTWKCDVKSINRMARQGAYVPANSEHVPEDNDQLNLLSVNLRSLEECRGHVKEYALVGHLRQRMLDWYRGRPDQDWVLDELMDCIDYFTDKESGLRFIARIHEKANGSNLRWLKLLAERTKFLLRHDFCYNVVCNLFEAGDDYMKAEVTRGVMESVEYLKPHSLSNRSLIRRVVSANPCNIELFKGFIEYDWIQNHTKIRLLCAFLEALGEKAYVVIAKQILSDIDFYSRHKDLQKVVTLMIRRGPVDIRNSVFSFLIGLPDEELYESSLRHLYLAMIHEASHDQLELFLLKFMRCLKNADKMASLSEPMVAALSVCPLREKLRFLLENEKALVAGDLKAIGTELMCAESSLILYKSEFSV